MKQLLPLGALAVVLLAEPALAMSARLLPELGTTGRALLAQASATPADPGPTTATTSAQLTPERVPYLLHLGVGAAAGVVTVPVGLYLAAGLGTFSIDFLLALVPAALAMGLVAPTLTTLAAWLFGNWREEGRFGFWLPWAASVVVNLAALVIAGFAGMSIGVPLQIVLYSLVEGVVLGGTAVGTMHLLQKRPPVTVRSRVPGVSDTTLVPLAQLAF